MSIPFDRQKEQSKLLLKHGKSTLYGVNVNGYPKHHFHAPLNPKHLPLSVQSAGRDDWEEGAFRFREHSEAFSLELVIEGEFMFEDNGRRFVGVPGMLFFVRLHSNSGMMCLSRFARKQTVILQGSMLETLLLQLNMEQTYFLCLSDWRMILKLFEKIETMLKNSEDAATVSAAAWELLLNLSKELPCKIPSPQKEILEYIDLHLGTDLSVPFLSRKFHLSSSTLHRIFLNHCGESPGRFICKQRMTMAAQLLKTSEKSVKEISQILGFQNQFYFSTLFRKYYGMPPGDYRRSSL